MILSNHLTTLHLHLKPICTESITIVFTRNRILWHLQDITSILSNPRSVKEIHVIDKKR